LRYYKDAEWQELTGGEIAFTYDVVFIKSNKTFSSRYDNYFSFGGNKKYHWGSLIISNVLIFLFTLIIFFILSRTVKKDLDKYNQNISIGDNVILDEHGWKQIASDVFRPPIHIKTLSAFIGTGFEIFCLIIISLVLYLIGLIKPEIRINMLDTIFICFFLFSVISGYISTFVYRNNGGKQWLKNIIVTALLCPLIALMVLGLVRLLLTFEQSNAGLKISHIALLCFLWLFVSSPLVLVGGLLALVKNNIKYPCKINALPTAIGPKPWYLHLQYISWIIGIIPFFTVFIEFVYLLNSLWSFNVYFLASYFSLALLMSIVLTSEISIIFVFVNLCWGDHKWWWKSFFVSASPALYVFIYSVFYFFNNMELTRFSAIVIYFLIMILISVVVALVLGGLGTLITFRFIFYIYSKIKFD
jgi:transmembrane 9 superfamily protein 2/4